MKLNKLETHDRLEFFTKQNFSIADCCQDLINKKPFGNHPFYIFAHSRTEDDNPSVKRIIWQPRLTKPRAQTNSMLFKAYPGSDNIKVIWMIPAEELWGQYDKGKMLQNKIVYESIEAYKTNRASLEAKEPDDLPDHAVEAIYKEIIAANNAKKGKIIQ